jgi:hypothetical protein
MTIRFACECGQQLAVRDENAGKRVRCTGCSSVVAVPDGTDEEPRKPAAASTIRFSCEECGKAIQTKAEFAGKKTKCPGCDAVVTIPKSGGAPAEAVQSEKPKPRRPREEDEDEARRDEDEEDRPKRGKKKKKARSGGMLWIGIAAGVLLLVGGGFAAWLLFFKGGGASSEFDLVPRDASLFATAKVSEMRKSEVGKKALEFVRKTDTAGVLKELEQKAGLSLEDIDRATAVMSDPGGTVGWGIIRTLKDIDQKKILEALKNPPEQTHQSKKYYVSKDPEIALSFIDARTVVISKNANGITQCLGLTKPKSGPLDQAIQVASSNTHHAVVGINGTLLKMLSGPGMMGREGPAPGPAVAGVALAPMQIGGVRPARPPAGGGGLGGAALLQGLLTTIIPQSMYATVNFKEQQAEYEVSGEYPDKDKAQTAVGAIKQVVDGVKGILALQKLTLGGKPAVNGVDPAAAIDQAINALGQIDPKQEGKSVKFTMKVDNKELIKGLDQLALAAGAGGGGGDKIGGGGEEPPGDDVVGRVKDAANRTTAVNNFHQVNLALINTAEVAGGQLPGPAIYDAKTGEPLLSWRVAILPQIEQNDLYTKIHLNERWDSQHNRQFWNQMPKQFELPGHNAGSGNTFLQTFKGPGTAFPVGKGLKLASFTDGRSNTVLIAEANAAVNWMAPDSRLDARLPKLSLGNHYKKGYLIGMADGVVGFLPSTVTEPTLKNAINPSDGNILGADWKLLEK